jgi:glycosyltransferase involved in cell wall biosynthesis
MNICSSRPAISIIVPVYKVEPYLHRCIDSILAQTFTDFECILIDDGSPDNCPAICDEYAKKDRRIIVIHQENKGVSAARNIGLDIAKGEWIGFVDSDDWCDEGMFQFLYENALKYDADVSICGIRRVSNTGNERIIKHKKSICTLNRNEAIIKMFTPGAFGGYSWNKLIKTSLIKGSRIRYDETKKYMEDTILCYHIFKSVSKVVYSGIPYYNYTSNPESVTRIHGLTDAVKTGFQTLDEIISLETDKKITHKVMLMKALFAHNVCRHYILLDRYKNDSYAFLSRIIKDNKQYFLIDFSISLKLKISYCLLLYPGFFCFLIKTKNGIKQSHRIG